LGWVRGFENGRGWNGALALPRLLTMGADGHPRQQPHPALQQLRGRRLQRAGQILRHQRHRLVDVESNTFELHVRFDRGDAQAVGLRVCCSDDGERTVEIRYTHPMLDVAGTEIALPLAAQEPLDLHLFVDRSVLELFVNDGRVAVTRIIQPQRSDLGVELVAEQGAAQVVNLELWEMGSIW
jgi:beta-fructofuranosidase